MQLQTLTELTKENVDIQSADCRLIILAPQLRNRNALLGWFAKDSQHTYYYDLTPLDNTPLELLRNLIPALQDMDSHFGRQSTQVSDQKSPKPEDLADALIYDLGKAKPKARYFVLDSLDQLTPGEDGDRFFRRLIANLPAGVQMVINARLLPYMPWAQYVRDGQAVVLGAASLLNGSIFNPEAYDRAHLEVYGFEGGRVLVNGLPMNTWDGPLPRNLFYYFVDHPMVTRDDIFETFWPELSTKEATNVFHVTKRKVSERIGYELTSYSGGFYRPSPELMVHYDVAAFEKAVQQGRETQGPASPDTWYQAIRTYRSQYLYGIDMPWIVKRREELRLAYTEALIGVGRLHKSLGDHERAISYYLRALREVPHREDIHRDVMTLYEARGEREKALAQYKYLADMLKRTLNITPSKPTRTLYAMLSGDSIG